MKMARNVKAVSFIYRKLQLLNYLGRQALHILFKRAFSFFLPVPRCPALSRTWVIDMIPFYLELPAVEIAKRWNRPNRTPSVVTQLLTVYVDMMDGKGM